MKPVHPGRILKRELDAREMSANRLALALRLPSGRITDILNGKRGVSPDTALRLGRFFGNSPRFWLNLTKAVEPTASIGAQLVGQYECRACHRIAGQGALKAPSLDGITLRSDDPVHVTLRLWLRDPQAVKGDTAMPNFRLSDSEIEAILAYLNEIDGSQ